MVGMKRTAEGDVAIAGGVEVEPQTAQTTTVAGPKLSDRPAGMPVP